MCLRCRTGVLLVHRRVHLAARSTGHLNRLPQQDEVAGMQVARETRKGEEMTDGDIGTRTGTGTGTDTGTDTGTVTETETGTETRTDTVTEIRTGIAIKIGTGTGTGTDTGTEIGTDTATEIGTGTGTDTGTDIATDTATEIGTGTGTGTKTGTVVETETDVEIATKAAAEAEAEAETQLDAALHQLLRLHHLRPKGIRIDVDQAPVLDLNHTPTTPTRKPVMIRNSHPLCRCRIFKTFLYLSQVVPILIPTTTSLTTSIISMSIGMIETRTNIGIRTETETEIGTGTGTETKTKTKTGAANSEESAGKKSNSAHIRHKHSLALLPWLASPAEDMSPTVFYGAEVTRTYALAAVGNQIEVNDYVGLRWYLH